MERIIITTSEEKQNLLKEYSKNKCLLNQKFYTFLELKKKLYFDYDLKTIFYIVSVYHVSVSIAKIYLENMYFLRDLDDETMIERLKLFTKSKGWNDDVIDKYLSEYQLFQDQSIQIVSGKLKTNREYIKKNNNGKNVNQLEANANKIASGKIGEKIVKKYEINKLRKIGKENLIGDVDIISQIDDQITHDGDGYDVLSFNEKGERIYIEVKTSKSQNSNHVNFMISQKEVEFMNGMLEDIDVNHCYIYYVTDVNEKMMTGKIRIIDHNEFKKYKLNFKLMNIMNKDLFCRNM